MVVVEGDVAVTGGAGLGPGKTRTAIVLEADESQESRSGLTVAKGQNLAFHNC